MSIRVSQNLQSASIYPVSQSQLQDKTSEYTQDFRRGNQSTKRLFKEGNWRDIQSSSNDFYLPSEMEKLRSLFPYLGVQQLEEVLSESDSNCGLACDKILKQQMSHKQQDHNLNPINGSIQFQSQSDASRVSKKRKRGQDQEIQLESRPQELLVQTSNLNRSQTVFQSEKFQEPVRQIQQESQSIMVEISQNKIKNLEESFSEQIMQHLLACQSTETAQKIVNEALKVYKDSVLKENNQKQENLIQGAMRENSILKKGIRIMNHKLNDSIQKGLHFDELAQMYHQQANDLEKAKEELIYYKNRALVNDAKYHGAYTHNNFHGGDGMVQ